MIAYESLEASIGHLGLDQEASEYHGILCGMLCHRDDAPADLGLANEPLPALPDGDGLLSLRRDSLQQLLQAHIEFELMLPDDDHPLSERVAALAQWCGGFLYGLATWQELDIRRLSDDAQEVLRDLTELSKAGFEPESGTAAEADERDYAELVEYVRVGAQLLFLELRQAISASSQTQETLH